MRFTSQAEKDAHELQRAIEALQAAMAEAAGAGNLGLVTELHGQFAEKASALAEARSRPVVGECRHCGAEMKLEDFRELVVCAIVDHRPGEIPQLEVFERGRELHLAYCRGCETESRLMVYLRKR